MGIKSWGLQSPIILYKWVVVVFSKLSMILQVLLPSTLSAAVAYCRALEYSLPTLALSSASLLAAASEKLPACFCCLQESCPADIPARVTLHPPPFARGREFSSNNHHLAPSVANFVVVVCCLGASPVGGRAYIARSFWVKSCLRA